LIGAFHRASESDSQLVGSSVNVVVCESPYAGISCTSTLVTNFNEIVTQPAGTYYYLALPIPAFSRFNVSLTISSSSQATTGTIFFKRGGYPFNTIYTGYDGPFYSAQVAYLTNTLNGLQLFEMDTVESDTWYFAVLSGSAPLVYAITINGPPSTTTATSTTSTTGSTKTNSTTSTTGAKSTSTTTSYSNSVTSAYYSSTTGVISNSAKITPAVIFMILFAVCFSVLILSLCA